ncbi:MAG TPA: hypothetical protein VGW77_26360 [Candidatus Binatia bacterium]|nr:hypothetical protein [Candidatus Binatia bacterium]
MELPAKQWSIGIYQGKNPFHFLPAAKINNPVLTRQDVSDVPAAFVADPFMIKAGDTWYMFFEVMNRHSCKGEIGLARSVDGIHWKYEKIVLIKPFHLSYPYVFEFQNKYYLMPECGRTKSIHLYRATRFPEEWRLDSILLQGAVYTDSSLFCYHDRWWIFTDTLENENQDTLRLYHADALHGPWSEHPQSPIIRNGRPMARPGGRVVIVDGQIVRYAQDNIPSYGTRIHALVITELTPTIYREEAWDHNVVLDASGAGWNGSGMHHIDPHQLEDGSFIACVDGRSAASDADISTGIGTDA